MIPDISSILRLPTTSDKDPAGRLISIPGMVDAAATSPVQLSGVPRLVAKRLRTGFFDMVELRIAKRPMAQRARKILFEPW